jgi:PPOX class probable F420-dependent enzyme
MAQPIEGRSRELLEAPNFCTIATLRDDGSPHVATVWADVQDGVVALNSAKGRAWPTHVERDPRVALVVVNQQNPYEYVEVRGRVTEITEEGADEHIDALARKYLGRDRYPFRTPDEQRIIVRVEPEKVRLQGA